MGKIRVKAFGDEELEQKQREEEQKRKEAKIAAAKSGAAEPIEEKVETVEAAEAATEETPKVEKKSRKLSEAKSPKGAFHSEKYEKLSEEVDKTKIYALKDALELLEKLQRKSFDETVELHLNMISTGISGQITLPHGTGKQTRVAIADEKLIAEIEKGIINFDVLVAEPQMMAKLAKVA
jgi:large subunit ribosomal protein L1